MRSRSNWNLEVLVFGREENRSTWRKTSWSMGREPTTNLNPHVALTPGFEPGLIISKKSTRTHIHGEASFKGNYKSMALSTRLEVGYELKITL